MYARLHSASLAAAGALVGALLTVACFALYGVLGIPDPWMDLLPGSGPTALGWLVGAAEMAVVFGLSGWGLAGLYNRIVPAAKG